LKRDGEEEELWKLTAETASKPNMWRLAKAMAWLPTQVCSQHLLRSEIILILPRNPHQLHIFLAYSIRFSTCLDPSVMLGFGMMI
jgi:hypothetical protein